MKIACQKLLFNSMTPKRFTQMASLTQRHFTVGKYPAFDLYGFQLSQPTRSVLFLCNENNIAYNFISTDARKLQTRKPDFLKLFPVGFVPAMNDQGFLLTEGPAILQYLCEKHHLSSWYPMLSNSLEDLQLRAKIHFWLHWNHTNTRISTRQILVPNYYPPKGFTKEEAMIKGKKDYSRIIKFVDIFLQQRYEQNPQKDGKAVFLCSVGHPTIADLMLLPEIDQISERGFNLFDYSPYPNVQQWLKSCQAVLTSYEESIAFVAKEAKEWTGFLPAKK